MFRWRTAKLFSYPTAHDPCLLIRLSQDQFVAYSQKLPIYPARSPTKQKRRSFSARVTPGALPWTMDESLAVHRNDRCLVFCSTFQAMKFGRLEYMYELATYYRASTTEHVFSLATLGMIVLLCLQIWLLIEVIHTSLGGGGNFSLLATYVLCPLRLGNWQLWGLLCRRVDNFCR